MSFQFSVVHIEHLVCYMDDSMSQLGEINEKVKTPSWTRFRYLLLFAAVFGGSLLVFSINNHAEVQLLNSALTTSSWNNHRYEIIRSMESFTIKTEGCTIPGLTPYNVNINKFIKRPKGVKPCTNTNYSLLLNNDTHIWINSAMLPFYDLPKDSNITCCYKSFYRPASIADISAGDLDDRVEYEACIDFTGSFEVINEFVRVTCGYDYRTLYEQFFLFAPKKPLLNTRDDSSEMPLNQSGYNVIIMGIDAISRLNFHRTMPRTLAYLKKKGAIELMGYNKVGDNTFPNLTPMLMGIKDTDLKRTCWPNSKSTFDNCPFIWEWFKDAGYYTALGEDSATLGTFNFEKVGFSGTPTDYYIRTFMHEAEMHVGNNRDFNSFLCMGDKYFYNVLLDYVISLTTTLKSSKLFGFFWEVTMSHDYLNYPMLMDKSYKDFFKRLDDTKYLEDTIFILLSDHGMRWGEIRFTKQGRLEERLPFVHILVPPSFRDYYRLAYENLKINSKRLTTPFDIYSTLSDLINLDSIKNEHIKTRSNTNYANQRSISLFLPIPGNRTCESAGIDDHWCTCHKSRKLSKNSEEARDAAAYLVKHLNILLRKHHHCAILHLEEILEVTEMVAGTPGEYEVGWREFTVVVRTEPGSGVFEATVRQDLRGWSLAGTVSRLNLYGKQSHCVHHYQLKLYCYCR